MTSAIIIKILLLLIIHFSVLPELHTKLLAKRDYPMPLRPICVIIQIIFMTAKDLAKRSQDSNVPVPKNYLLMLQPEGKFTYPNKTEISGYGTVLTYKTVIDSVDCFLGKAAVSRFLFRWSAHQSSFTKERLQKIEMNNKMQNRANNLPKQE